VSRISIRSWEEWVEGFSNLFNKILYDLKPGWAHTVAARNTQTIKQEGKEICTQAKC